MKKIILMTGGTGFIGSRLQSLLLQNGYIVRSIARSIQSEKENLEFIKSNLEEQNLKNHIFKDVKKVFHVAGIAHDTNHKKNYELYRKINVDFTIDLASNSIKNGVEKFVFFSSSKASYFDNFDKKTIYNIKNSKDIYGLTKREAELRLIDLCRNTKMKLIIIRPSLVYGEGVKGNLGSMINGIRHKWFPSLPITNNSKSLIHVDDLVQGAYFLINLDNLDDIIFNFTDGHRYSSDDIYSKLCKALGFKKSKITVPYWFFRFISFFHPSLRYKINKIFSTEFYSNEKIIALGFKPKFNLSEIYKKSF